LTVPPSNAYKSFGKIGHLNERKSILLSGNVKNINPTQGVELWRKTMSSSSLTKHAVALRSAFCEAGTRSILRLVASEASVVDRKQAMTQESGISDNALLDQLIMLGVEVDTLAAVSLVPLIVVAWSDGELQDKERSAILIAAKESGLGRVAYELVKHWLQQKPSDQLLTAWMGYITAISESSSTEVKEKLKSDVLGRAYQVAETAGGILGFNKTTESEQSVLDVLERAFTSF
jgi:hypothetical protein